MGDPTFTTTRLGETNCPNCGHQLDAATHTGGSEVHVAPGPRPDDVTVCIECLTALQFTAGVANALGVKPLDWSVLDNDPESKADLGKTIRLIKKAKGELS